MRKRLAGRAVDLADERRGGDREGVADDARQPFVVLVLQRRLARLDQAELRRHEFHHAPARRIAAHQRVEIVLELPDLIERPFLRQRREGVGGRAGAIIVERRRVAPQRDVDGERDLLDRAHAVEPMGADVAREIEQLVGGEIGGGHAVQHLLIGGVGRLGRAAVLADERRDGRAVDDVEGIELAARGEARIEGRGVDDQHVLEPHAQPGGRSVAAIGAGEEGEVSADARRRRRRRCAGSRARTV